MTKQTALVKDNQLFVNGLLVCAIDTPEWFAWLNSNDSFRYQSNLKGPVRNLDVISVHSEKRGKDVGWYANRRTEGKLYRRYVGTTRALTGAKLDEITKVLNEI